jgi:hypothetical protein
MRDLGSAEKGKSQDQRRFDNDAQVQKAIRLVFETFERSGKRSAYGSLLPRTRPPLSPKIARGRRQGGFVVGAPTARAHLVLHTPRYAGAFVYGRTRTRRLLDGRVAVIKAPRSEWQFVTPGMHKGYIDWHEFKAIQRRLTDNARAFGGDRKSRPVREGPALLQGRVLCGFCGEGMSVHYNQEQGQIVPVRSARKLSFAEAAAFASEFPARSSTPPLAPC